ncbi:guanine nucleotide exchange protein for ADP-robosylation factor [Borealophlyctis nickersoniae]|nr:guanine nucleotide exchange protein for ADP-robosylation factor [Borealophlyctis nickersoniae]
MGKGGGPGPASIASSSPSTSSEAPRSSTATAPSVASTPGGGGASTDVFIKLALQQLTDAKEAKKVANLKEAVKGALEILDSSNPYESLDSESIKTIFSPFQLACQSRQPQLASISIDLLGKLFSYNYWSRHDIQDLSPPSETSPPTAGADLDIDQGKNGRVSADDERSSLESDAGSGVGAGGNGGMIALVVDTICNSLWGENTDEKVQLQIVKALLSAVSSTDGNSTIHGGVLLNAIRTTFNIFLNSKSANTQIVAQATLTQMVQAVFGRVPKDLKSRSADDKPSSSGTNPPDSNRASVDKARATEGGNGADAVSPASVASSTEDGADVGQGSSSIDSLNSAGNADDKAGAALTALGKTSAVRASHDILADTMRKTATSNETIIDQYIKDAYLVFRALAKLTMRPIPAPEGATDLKSTAMRSKLLSLHLVHTVLSSHLYIFFAPSPVLFAPGTPPNMNLFVHAVKQYLCLTLSRNAASVVPQVFDISMEIFGRVLIGLRSVLKKELSVIFTEIILPIVEGRSTITFHQRSSLFRSLQRILAEPTADGGRALVEMYLNYDCDPEATARENIWERLINAIAKMMTQHYDASANAGQAGATGGAGANSKSPNSSIPPAITTATMTSFTKEQVRELYSSSGDYGELKKRGLELMVRGVLRPLVQWCNARMPPSQSQTSTEGENAVRKSEDTDPDGNRSLGLVTEEDGRKAARKVEDDPTAFETLKHRKQVLLEGIKRFNFKPKKGMQYLLDSNCIASRTPRDIARFLLNTEGLNKTMIGEFLGEGEDENIAIMHAFVDEMDFAGMRFVDAIRAFLQTFRLPGEAQKIDRFMLKFADRYLRSNPQVFNSADTAYTLAYSVIMLNTDQFNPQVRKRMTKADFVKNNRGIDEGNDLPLELLEGIYDEIQSNEIVMKDEQPAKSSAGDKSGEQSTYRSRKEVAQFAQATENMALRTEAIFNTMLKSKPVKRSSSNVSNSGGLANSAGSLLGMSSGTNFYVASHYEHVKPMFQIIWMSVLTGISTPLQESEDMETIVVALEGFKHAARIACLFDMELERKAFISTLGKFTQLGNMQDMRAKNLEATKTLLEIAYAEGNSLGDSWKDAVLCISQLEKLQLVGQGSESDPSKGRLSTDARMQRRESTQSMRPTNKGGFLEEAAAEAGSQGMTLMVDRIFTASVKLSGSAIVSFVRALCVVSWDEITSSSDREHPRMYCLQRLVEISYYNMKRIRVEWSNIWAILGEHFNQVGCHTNSNVAFFALDKLRQLAMKFLELEELPNFKFQKDFLRPFETVIGTNPDPKIKDMVLACLQQMFQAKGKSIKSGWKAMFGAFTKAAKEGHEPIVLLAFDIVKAIYKNNFESVVANQTFPDFISCLVEFCKNRKFARTSLHAVELLRASIPRIHEMSKTTQNSKHPINPSNSVVVRSSENIMEATSSAPAGNTAVQTSTSSSALPSHKPEDDPSFKFWFPILFGLYEVIMTCDLEVRTRGLNYLFETLKQYGAGFSHDFWEVISKGVLFPIFDDLRLSRQEHTKFANKEDMSVWLSTTLIQALRQFIDLFSHYFDTLSFQLDGVLELLTICMTQENETLARIGSTCLQQFIENNVGKLDEKIWAKVCTMFVHLFEVTTPHALFFDLNDSGGDGGASGTGSDREPLDDDGDGGNIGAPSADNASTMPRANSSPQINPKTGRPLGARPQKKEFQQIIVKCVLHLLIIQTLDEVLRSGPEDAVYKSLTSQHLFTLIDCLERSYRFAQAFNEDMELRMALYRMGFMRQLPNLLKQETSSVSSYILVLIKMYSDPNEERRSMRIEIEKRLIPLSYDIICHYNTLDPDSKRRNVNAWRPVVVTILNALVDFDEDQFKRHISVFYGEVVNLLLQDLTPDVRLVLHSVLIRTGVVCGLLDERAVAGGAGQPQQLTAVKVDGGSADFLAKEGQETTIEGGEQEAAIERGESDGGGGKAVPVVKDGTETKEQEENSDFT